MVYKAKINVLITSYKYLLVLKTGFKHQFLNPVNTSTEWINYTLKSKKDNSKGHSKLTKHKWTRKYLCTYWHNDAVASHQIVHSNPRFLQWDMINSATTSDSSQGIGTSVLLLMEKSRMASQIIWYKTQEQHRKAYDGKQPPNSMGRGTSDKKWTTHDQKKSQSFCWSEGQLIPWTFDKRQQLDNIWYPSIK